MSRFACRIPRWTSRDFVCDTLSSPFFNSTRQIANPKMLRKIQM